MRLTRIFVPGPLAVGTQAELPAQAGTHLTRVLRLEAGAPMTLFNGAGGEYAATLLPGTGRQVLARVTRHDVIERESPLRVILLQGVARGERMDLIVQKATELGVTHIVPVLAERSVVKVDAKQRERKREHWQAIATSACEQCGRNRVPEIGAPLPLEDSLGALPADGLRCLLAANGAAALARAVTDNRQPVVLLIGPEGGLAENEREVARANGFVDYRLGPRVMRTETAGLAALAVLQAVAGDFFGMSNASQWFAWALSAAVFAALTTIFAKLGLAGIDPDFATLIRTAVILLLLVILVMATGKWSNPLALPPRTLGFLLLSALATGASWVCYFRALQMGDAALVSAVDKASLLLVAIFAVSFLGERPGAREWLGIALVSAGVLVLGLRR